MGKQCCLDIGFQQRWEVVTAGTVAGYSTFLECPESKSTPRCVLGVSLE